MRPLGPFQALPGDPPWPGGEGVPLHPPRPKGEGPSLRGSESPALTKAPASPQRHRGRGRGYKSPRSARAPRGAGAGDEMVGAGPLRWLWGLRCTWGAAGPWARIRGARGLASPLDPHVTRDLLLFRHERRPFFRLLGLFCASQFACWAVLARLAFKELQPDGRPAGSARPALTLPGGVSINLVSSKWRYGLTVSCLTFGSLIVVVCFMLSRRSVGQIVLRQGGRDVTLSTYYLFGLSSSFTVPLRQVSCMAHRSEVSSIPLKVKGRPFYFLLDKQGQIYNSQLFDLTVGTYRKL
ncbi:transmembrane protein 223 [Emydura macquarii macquarii]|uniref:transmembrane protein 223 n=1 Tax=Emydura macquarii macquarii TaxID=1129001 RepID=UPI00352A16E7